MLQREWKVAHPLQLVINLAGLLIICSVLKLTFGQGALLGLGLLLWEVEAKVTIHWRPRFRPGGGKSARQTEREWQRITNMPDEDD